jgi:hypothetical protein
MSNPLRYGNKAALVVGVLFMLIDDLPMAHELGAWGIGCLLCVWYSASAIHEDSRINRKVKYGLFAYLAIVLVLALWLHGADDEQAGTRDWSLHPALNAMGIGKK